ncbi:gamma-hemolysin subunit B, partial [Klebsiella pneumoniae]|nr:gamma-hemolysin subunit B [Klebsiella pneumoniae]
GVNIVWTRRRFRGYWSGENHVDKKEGNLSALYEVDWKTHNVKFVKVLNDNEKK